MRADRKERFMVGLADRSEGNLCGTGQHAGT